MSQQHADDRSPEAIRAEWYSLWFSEDQRRPEEVRADWFGLWFTDQKSEDEVDPQNSAQLRHRWYRLFWNDHSELRQSA